MQKKSKDPFEIFRQAVLGSNSSLMRNNDSDESNTNIIQENNSVADGHDSNDISHSWQERLITAIGRLEEVINHMQQK